MSSLRLRSSFRPFREVAATPEARVLMMCLGLHPQGEPKRALSAADVVTQSLG